MSTKRHWFCSLEFQVFLPLVPFIIISVPRLHQILSISLFRLNKGYESTASTLVIVECQLEDLA